MAVSLSTPRSDRPHSELVVACAVSWQAGTNSRAPIMSPTLIKLMRALSNSIVYEFVTCRQPQHMVFRSSNLACASRLPRAQTAEALCSYLLHALVDIAATHHP